MGDDPLVFVTIILVMNTAFNAVVSIKEIQH